MKNKNELLDKQNKNVTFEEMEKVEEFGAAQDYITGASIGIGIVAAIVALTRIRGRLVRCWRSNRSSCRGYYCFDIITYKFCDLCRVAIS